MGTKWFLGFNLYFFAVEMSLSPYLFNCVAFYVNCLSVFFAYLLDLAFFLQIYMNNWYFPRATQFNALSLNMVIKIKSSKINLIDTT